MEDTNKLIDLFIDKINDEVFRNLSIKECGRIYSEQDILAMTGILKNMHNAFVSVYHTELLDYDYEWVMLPAVIRAQNSGLLTVGLVTLDLQSSGEHWGTNILTPAGMMNLHDDDRRPEFRERMIKQWCPYDYYYTPFVEGDIHVDYSCIPEAIREMLNACRADEAEPDFTVDTEIEDDLEL